MRIPTALRNLPLQPAGVVLIVLACLVSLILQADLSGLIQPAGPSRVAGEIARVSCLVDDLPAGVNYFGFLPSLPRRMEDPAVTNNMVRLRSRDYEALFLTQFTLAPRLIAYDARGEWVIGNYPDYETGLEATNLEELMTVVKDCGNGVFLLRKK